MSKYIIDTDDYIFDVDGALIVGFDCDNKPATFYNSLENLEELNSDYINEHYGQLQDEAYQKGFEDGKKSVEDEGLRNNINLIVTQCGYSLDEINDMIQKMRGERQ